MTKKFCSALLMGLFAGLFSQAMMAQTIVCVETNLDTFCMKLKEAEAPIATGNFLRYVDNQGYDNTLIHESVRNGYLLGGIWQASLEKTPVFTAGGIPNEYSLPNTPYTVAMVTQNGQPDSATSGWRINVADNSDSFSKANSGAVFAEILGTAGKAVVDHLAKLSTHTIKATDGTAFLSQAPLLQIDAQLSADDLVQVKRMYRYEGPETDFDLGVPGNVLTDLVCMDTSKGELCIKLYDDVPITTTNFLGYVNSGAYDNTVIHRSVASFVVQGGGFRFDNGAMVAVTAGPAIVDENKHSNTRGTIALAKSGVNTATSQWFFNESDSNAAQLDLVSNSGGFAAFGVLIPSSLATLDAMAAVAPTNQTATLGATFGEIPLVNVDGSLTSDDFITINKVFQTSRLIPIDQPLLSKIVSMTSYDYLYPDSSGNLTLGARFPVRVGNKLYMVVLNNHFYTDDEVTAGLNADGVLRFDVDTTRIVELKDTGRIAATYDGQTLTLATVRLATEVYANVVLKLINAKTLEFQLVSYEAF